MLRKIVKNKLCLFKALLIMMAFAFMFSVRVNAASYIEGGANISVGYEIQTNKRTTQYEITDSSEMKQSYDVVNLSDWDTSVESMKNQGYVTLIFIFQIDIAEKDDGYQEIYIYSENGNQLVSPTTKFEHGINTKNTNFTTYEFYAEINLDDIVNDKIIVRYGANGWFSDNWYNKNFGVQICASNSIRKYTQIVHIV